MEEKKKFKLGLLPKLIIAIIVGILLGQFLPEGFCRFVVTLSSFFSQFLSFIIPLMILAYVTMGIANLKSGAGKLLLITVAIAYCSTLIAGSASFFCSRHPVPALHECGRARQDRRNRRQLAGAVLQPGNSGADEHAVRCCYGVCARSVHVQPARQDHRRHAVQRHFRLLRHH